jgi:inner membrane protein
LRFWACAVLASILPDLDVLAFKLGIPYAHPFGHRGFFHSLCFALIWGLASVPVFFRAKGLPKRQLATLALTFFALTASHDLLDAMTNGGLGVALLAPFSDERIFFPFMPIQVSPIGLRSFFSGRGLEVLANEVVWVWVPVAVLGCFACCCRMLRAKGRSSLAAPDGSASALPGRQRRPASRPE